MYVPSAGKKRKRIAFNGTVLRRQYDTEDHDHTPVDTIMMLVGEQNTVAAPETFYMTKALVHNNSGLEKLAALQMPKNVRLQPHEEQIAAIEITMTNKWHNPNKRKKKPSIN